MMKTHMNYRTGIIFIPTIIITLILAIGASSYFFIFREAKPPRTASQTEITEQQSISSVASIRDTENTETKEAEKEKKKPSPASTSKTSLNPPISKERPVAAPLKESDNHSSSPINFSPPPFLPVQRQSPEFPTQTELKLIPSCAGQQFVTTPVDTKRLTGISPLGNLAPPGHTLPTEHMFFHITAGNVTTETIPLNAPADIYLTLIAVGHGFTQDPVDYTLYFALCQDVIGYYNHVKELSPELEDLVSQSSCMFSGESKETRCNMQTLNRVANGTVMGRVGRLQGNFDFGLIDFRKPLNFANPSRYGKRSLYIQCALDYYSLPGKSALYALLERGDGKCGLTAQDVPGTLKGNWFYASARADMGGDWDKLLAFADDNRNPSTSVISIGGIISSAEKWEFTPESSGIKNHAFSDVSPDGQVYCYEATGKTGRIIVQLTSQTELKIEKQNQPCSGQRIFVDPTKYTR